MKIGYLVFTLLLSLSLNSCQSDKEEKENTIYSEQQKPPSTKEFDHDDQDTDDYNHNEAVPIDSLGD